MKSSSDLFQNDLWALFNQVESIAKKYYDGHFCIFAFTTGYKGCFGTIAGKDLRSVLAFLPQYTKKQGLLYSMCDNHEMFYCGHYEDLIDELRLKKVELQTLNVGDKFFTENLIDISCNTVYQVISKDEDGFVMGKPINAVAFNYLFNPTDIAIPI